MSKKELIVEQIRDMLMNGTTSVIPGGAYLRGVLDFRQDLKQRRVIHFLEFFLSEVGKISGKSEDEILDASTNEEFIDIFDSVIEKIHQTKSEQKAKRFSDLLIKQIVEPLPDYFILKIINILHGLNDIQIHMLKKLNDNHHGKYFSNSFYDLFGESLVNEYGFYNLSLTDDTVIKVHETELELYLKDLVSLGFVLHELENKLKHPGKHRIDEKLSLQKREKYRISKSGKSFLNLITTEQI